jgi:hypothetical protein
MHNYVCNLQAPNVYGISTKCPQKLLAIRALHQSVLKVISFYGISAKCHKISIPFRSFPKSTLKAHSPKSSELLGQFANML